MSGGLQNEFESMLNVALGASSLAAFVAAFDGADGGHAEHLVTMWHIVTVLPLVYHPKSIRAVSKRRVGSGLRSILLRDAQIALSQNEAIAGLNDRARALFPRTARSLNCAVAWGLIEVVQGAFYPGSRNDAPSAPSEARDIVQAAAKLGAWAGGMSDFEYFTVLGIEI